MLGEHLFDFALGRLDTDDQALHPRIVVEIGRNCLNRADEIVVNRQDVARKTGRGVCPSIGHVLFHPAAHVLRLGSRVKRLIIRLFELLLKLGDPVMFL